MKLEQWVSSVLLIGLLPIFAQAQHPSSDGESRAATVLFEQFETVFYSEASMLSRSDRDNPLSSMNSGPLRRPFVFLWGGLNSLGEQTSADVRESAEAFLVGAKDFRLPKGFGLVRSQLCYVVVLKGHSAFDLRKHFRTDPVASAAGAAVWNWSADIGEFGEDDRRPSSLYAAQIADSYLLFSNNLQELETVAVRLASSREDFQMLVGIREWELFSQHRIWGYRRYRHQGAADKEAAGLTWVAPSSEILIFFVDVEKKTSTLRLFSSPRDKRAPAKKNLLAALPPFKPRGAGAWETIVPLAEGDVTYDRTVAITWIFGFGVCV